MSSERHGHTTSSTARGAATAADAPAGRDDGEREIARRRRDGERDALLRLAKLYAETRIAKKPDDALQAICEAARELTRGRYAALAVTDQRDRTEGFFT